MHGSDEMQLKFKHFIILNALDVLLSWYAFTQVFGLSELNPVYVALFAVFGIAIGLVVGKVFLLILTWVFYLALPLNNKISDNYTINMKKVSVTILCSMMMFVVGNNFVQIMAVL